MFSGFGMECFEFLVELKHHNERTWFNANKKRYLTHVIGPAKAFVGEFGKRLKELSENLVADDRTNGAGSIFRIYRDTRFSKDKTPYKTHLGILFWEGPHKKMTSPGYYFHIDPEGVTVHGGMYVFPKPVLTTYRNAVAQEPSASEIRSVVSELDSAGLRIGGHHYKRVPRGFDKDHVNAELLKHKGLYAVGEPIPPAESSQPDFLDRCFEQCERIVDLHRWLTALHQISPPPSE